MAAVIPDITFSPANGYLRESTETLPGSFFKDHQMLAASEKHFDWGQEECEEGRAITSWRQQMCDPKMHGTAAALGHKS